MKYSLDNLLRKPLEWWSSSVCLLVSVWLLCSTDTWVLSDNMRHWLACGLFTLSVVRFLQGYQVYRYQRNLKRLAFYAMSSDELPISHKKLFLGKGFQWEVKHTQRLRDVKQSGNTHFLKPSKLYLWTRQFELQHEHSERWKSLLQLFQSTRWWNPIQPLPEVGGNAAIHGVEPHEKDIYMNLSERVGHTMILGTTRVGKTRLLELLIASDIRRNDSAVIVFDPKGDTDLLKRVCFEAKRAGREHDVVVFHLGYPSHSARYNPIGNFARITEVANRVANQLPSSGESAAFKEFAWRFVNIIAGTLVALGRKPNYKELDKYILNIDPLLTEYCEKWLTGIQSEWKRAVEQQSKTIDE
ncbi:MAG: conjugative transfer system coupling protein TraD, partial [Gammaproteobacteria bacterium]|nr:conjugative transfer system coupling protein TraD [Gammaproteobacteria bacterium]